MSNLSPIEALKRIAEGEMSYHDAIKLAYSTVASYKAGEDLEQEKRLLDFCHFLGKKGYKINGYDDNQLNTIISQFNNL